MKKWAVLVVVMLLVSGLAVSAVFAITYGTPDNGRHPGAGAMVGWSADGALRSRCSGTLVARNVFLTAAHCGAIWPVLVSFDEILTPDSPIYEGTFIADPQFRPGDSRSDNHDIAVIILTDGPDLPTATLPTLGQFDGLIGNNRSQQFTAVGYGLSEPTTVPGQGVVRYRTNARLFAVSSINTVTPFYFHFSQNPVRGDAGACNGDSGGPVFAGAGNGETNVLAGITVTGDAICRATNDVYRLDIPSTRAFLASMGVYVP